MKLFKASGRPINPGDEEKQLAEMHEAFDKLEEQMGKCTAKNAKAFEAKLAEQTNGLLTKYPIEAKHVYPRTKGQLRAALEKYGSIAYCIEDGKIVAYVLDQ